MKKECLLAVVLLVVAFPSTVFAYLDPGTGSYLLQFLIGGIVSAFFALRVFGRSLKDKLSKMLDKKERR